jgi:HSP20 family molecular chaperone IbpA
MKCPRCGSKIDARWKFCPSCGAELERRIERDFFGDVFERMQKEMGDMNRAFERNFEVIDLSPFFTRPVKGSGFSVKITQGTGQKPKVSIQTFGDVSQKEVEKEVSKLGFKERISKAIRPEKAAAEAKGVCLGRARTTEEPETCVRKTDGKILVEVKLPGVKDAQDIEIRSLENSIEVRAIAGEKAYFKILTKPPETSIFNRTFKNGLLTIELA